MSRLLARLEDFRLLPFFVLFSMAVGILIGNALSISDFTLTPPILSGKQASSPVQKLLPMRQTWPLVILSKVAGSSYSFFQTGRP